ncbi:MAG: hypothetical protein GSR79_01115 [Desulfurococcales archaeon]|nr:hypothetical protein [Desulfurococcales archaeon]
MSSSQRSTASGKRLIIWSILESVGLLTILLSDLGITILTLGAKLKIWKWRNTRQFRKRLEKAKMPRDLMEYLVDEYKRFLDRSMSINKLLGTKSISGFLEYAKVHNYYEN